MNKRIKKKHFKTVFNRLASIPLFRGEYDALNGEETYMYGIASVMDLIAHEAGHDEFQDIFISNKLKSEEQEHE